MSSDLLSKINLDKFYQAGTILSFLILITALTFDIKILNNVIIALYSLAFIIFFIGYWVNIKTSTSVFHSSNHSHDSKSEYYKLNKLGITFYIVSIIILLLAFYQTYVFL